MLLSADTYVLYKTLHMVSIYDYIFMKEIFLAKSTKITSNKNLVPYLYKFSRGLNLTNFVDETCSAKI